MKLLDHADPRFRDAAAQALAHNKHAIEPLVRLLQTTRDAALEKLVHELPEALEPEDERMICQCVMRLLPALPEADT